MSLIRQYLKQKMARSFSDAYDLDVIKKEIKDEVTHILYDQTRRTPIVIPVINEIGGGLKAPGKPTRNAKTPAKKPTKDASAVPVLPKKHFPTRQVPDTEANDTKARERAESRAY